MYDINIPCAKVFEKTSQFKAFVVRSFSIQQKTDPPRKSGQPKMILNN